MYIYGRLAVTAAIIVVGVVVFVCSIAQADNKVVVHLASKHAEPGYEEFNPGIGLRIPLSWYDTDFGFGVYRNSFKDTSLYVGITKSVITYGRVDLRLSGGVVTGYVKNVAPFILPEVGIKLTNRMAAVFSYIPAVEFGDLKTVGAVGLSLEIQ